MGQLSTLWLTTTLLALTLPASLLAADSGLAIVSDAKLPAAAVLALQELEEALAGRGVKVERRDATKTDGIREIVVGLASESPEVQRQLTQRKLTLAALPESLLVHHVDQRRLLIAGRDARGLAFALRDVARSVACAPPGGDGLAAVRDVAESPFLGMRTLSVHLFNSDLEASWYFDEPYWKAYFSMLSRHRFNNLTLTFCDQTNYLCPLYSNLLEVPGFPGVRVQGVTAASQQRNLAMLKRIAELAHDHGLDLTLGLWQQVPVPAYPPKVDVTGIPEGVAGADYCAAGLKAVLKACPAIDAVQLRMNAEAGVAEDHQTGYYRPLFHAIRDCGRPVRVELRYKGLQPETTRAALDAGLAVNVSTKFWAEHFGLPYHATVVDSHYRKDRYGFGSVLSHPRPYGVIFQHWTAGSQRLTVWGDPDYAAKFARSCKAAGGVGYEVFAPLTNRGYGNSPGKSELFLRDPMTPIQEQERFWYFYLCFGRLGYNPDADVSVWRRELRQRYLGSAPSMESLYQTASKILPLITATRMPSASEWSWWPEMDTGDRLREYARTQPGDTAQFYAIRTWERTPKWRAEAWDTDVPGYVEDALAGKLRGKWTPWDVSRELDALAAKADHFKTIADLGAWSRDDPRLKTASRDFLFLPHLARYHAAKTRASTHLEIFSATGEPGRLGFALKQLDLARLQWQKAAEVANLTYSTRVSFGTSPTNARNKFGHHHSGNRLDRLGEFEEDAKSLQTLIRKNGNDRAVRPFPGETEPTPMPRVEHTRPVKAISGADLEVVAKIDAERPIERVVLHSRPLDQTAAWTGRTMSLGKDGTWAGTIPGTSISSKWDLQYYLEVLGKDGGGRNWPNWQEGMPYVIVSTK